MMLIFHYYITNQNMKTDKEYPATHSMSTAWYCVDDEGNVGIFDINDNGPIPEGWPEDLNVNEIFWGDFSMDGKDGIRDFDMTREQITPMLMPMDVPDRWEEHSFEGKSWMFNGSWENVIVKIDMAKYPILVEAASLGNKHHEIVCLSRKEGYFFLQFAYNIESVKLLEEKHVILSKYKAPLYDEICEDEDPESQDAENKRLPLFIYHEEYNPEDGPAKRMTTPSYPMKLSQLPKDIQDKITRLPVKFKDAEHIQLGEYIPVIITE